MYNFGWVTLEHASSKNITKNNKTHSADPAWVLLFFIINLPKEEMIHLDLKTLGKLSHC